MYFDGPDTMGNAAMYGSAFRDATISVSGDFVQDVPNWIAYAAGASLLGLGVSIADAGKSAAGIQALLNSKGWIVENVSDQSGWMALGPNGRNRRTWDRFLMEKDLMPTCLSTRETLPFTWQKKIQKTTLKMKQKVF